MEEAPTARSGLAESSGSQVPCPALAAPALGCRSLPPAGLVWKPAWKPL